MPELIEFAFVATTALTSATGAAGRGADTTVDPDLPVTGPTLKGLMRDAARELLGWEGASGADVPLIREVFGWRRQPSPWHWSDLHPGSATDVATRTRIRIDPATGTAARGALLVAEEVSPLRGIVRVSQRGVVGADRHALHVALLMVCGRLVHGLGSGRRRGKGWVDLTPLSPVLTAEDIALVLAARGGGGS